MKKTLAALAVLGAFAGSAMAADVTLYGAMDTGFAYTNHKVTGSESENKLEMQTGYDTSNRWGLKGSEDLGNGYQVSFKLENGFSGDDGTLNQGGRLFGREAGLTLSGPFGSVAFGRFGGLSSSCGTYDMLGYVESFDGGDNAVWGFAASDRFDNMVVYQTPRFAGLQVTAQYSFKTDSTDEKEGAEGTSRAERYASIGLSGEYGPAQFAVGYESMLWGSAKDDVRNDQDKGQLVFVGGNYDFEVVQIFAEGQYFKHQTSISGFGEAFENDIGDVKGYGLHVGAAAPVGAAGKVTVGLYYTDATDEQGADDVDYKYLGASARYNYSLSARTGLYVGAGYAQVKQEKAEDTKDKTAQVYCGLVHTF